MVLAAGGGLILFLLATEEDPPLSADGWKVVVYVGTPQCGACVHYEATDRPGFRRQLEAKGWSYREAIAPSLYRLNESGYWPGDLAWARRQVTHIRGTPTFLLFDDRKLVREAFGWSRALRTIVPMVA